MAAADIYAGLDGLLAREPDGDNNDGDNNAVNDIGQVDDTYIRITPASYFFNASDGPSGGPNGMGLPVSPTGSFPGFTTGFFATVLDFEGRGAGVLPDILVGDLPQAQAISDAVMALGPNDQNHPSTFAVNEVFDFFGQLLTHDVAEASTGATTDLPMLIDGLPFPFARTPYELDGAGVRQQINEETAFLDLSMVYGNSQAREDLARADLAGGGQSAKLLLGAGNLLPTIKEVGLDAGVSSLDVLSIFTETGFGGLPNPATNPDPATFENLFYAGDNRVNQQGPLIVLQTTWAREHNYQVDQLTSYATAQNWSQDQLFEAARAINEAEFQNVVFKEYVPKLIGTQADNLLAAYKANHSAIDGGIINEWTTVAFRFGHDQSSNDYTLLNADNSTYLQASLGTVFALAGAAQDVKGAAHSAADIDAWIRGLSAQFTQEIDGKVADGNRAALFGLGVTADLEAFDIQRARDHGVWNYNQLRAGLGLTVYASFDAFAAANGYALNDAKIVALKSVYGDDISKLDSVVGGLLEKDYADSQLGETFTLLNAIQFDVLKHSDNFYFEDRLANNPELTAEIKGTTFAEIMERNSGVDHLHLDSFGVANRMAFGNSADTKYGADLAAYLKADLMIGGGRNDTLSGKEGSDTLYGDTGNDKLSGGNGNDFLRGGDGDDSLFGGAGNDNAAGDKGNDGISLDAGDDWANGNDGDDEILGGDGDDILLGKQGNDKLSGGKDNDQLFGGDGKDSISGGTGNDKAFGGAGNDIIDGDAGNDTISGDAGNDRLDGGSGNDTFIFQAGFGQDRISGFDANPSGGQDFIDLVGFGINAGNFASHVVIKDVGSDTLITIDHNVNETILLVGVGNATTVTVSDFLFA